MDWPNLFAYCVILFYVTLLGWRISSLRSDVARLGAHVSYLAFVSRLELTGMTREQIQEAVQKVESKVMTEIQFAEIAEKTRRPWWRRRPSFRHRTN